MDRAQTVRRVPGRAGHWAMRGLIAIALASTVLLETGRSIAMAGEKVELRGAGATFPVPLCQKWIEVFRRQQPDVGIAYDVVGSDGSLAVTWISERATPRSTTSRWRA